MKTCADPKTTTPTCRGGWLERPRYFPRQLITPAEMNLEQDYFRQRLRMHNRMLHGWGVVCGALVCPVKCEPWQVKVEPGYVLGPQGDEIYIDCEHLLDLRTGGLSGAAGEPAEYGADPWCSEVYVEREPGGPLYVAVRYDERMARPVRAQPAGCGCGDEACEYSRWCDGYVIGVLDACPESHLGEAPGCEPACEGPNPPCPPCVDDPWVVLARVDVASDGTIEKIDNCECRRMVVSFGHLWWRCKPRDIADPGGFEVDEIRAFDPESNVALGKPPKGPSDVTAEVSRAEVRAVSRDAPAAEFRAASKPEAAAKSKKATTQRKAAARTSDARASAAKSSAARSSAAKASAPEPPATKTSASKTPASRAKTAATKAAATKKAATKKTPARRRSASKSSDSESEK